MHVIRTLFATLLWITWSTSSIGQEAATPEEPAAPAEVPAPPDTRPLDEIFIPSQEIAADEEVTFPVNI